MKKRLFTVALILVFAVSLMSGCKSGFLGGNAKDNLKETQPASSIDSDSDQTTLLDGKLPVTIYFADQTSGKLKKEIRYIPKVEATKSLNNLAAIIVNQILDGPDPKSGIKRVISQDVKLVGDIKIDISGAKATVNLSKEFSDAIEGGSSLEVLAVKSIVDSLTELKEIQMVQIQIEGSTTAVLKGGTKISEPYKRDTSIIFVETLAEDQTTATDNNSGIVATKKPDDKKTQPSKVPTKAPNKTPAATDDTTFDPDGDSPASSITDDGE